MFKSIAAVATVAALTFASPVVAAPVASFTMTPAAVGVPVTFDGSASTCDTPTCSIRWTLSWTNAVQHRSYTLVSLQGAVVVWTPTVYDAMHGVITVVEQVTSGGGTNNFRVAVGYLVVAKTVA